MGTGAFIKKDQVDPRRAKGDIMGLASRWQADIGRPPGCLICGDMATVATHLMPQALVPHPEPSQLLSVGSVFERKIVMRPSGPVDHSILCRTHLDRILDLEAHAAELTLASEDPDRDVREAGFALAGADVDRLVRFAASVIWRYAVSSLPAAASVIDEQEPMLRAVVFADAPVAPDPETHIWKYRSKLTDLSTVALPPTRAPLLKAIYWSFFVGGLGFFQKADMPRMIPEKKVFRINGSNRHAFGYKDFDTAPETANLAAMMGIQLKAKAAKRR